jgi:hypothetical protein
MIVGPTYYFNYKGFFLLHCLLIYRVIYLVYSVFRVPVAGVDGESYHYSSGVSVHPYVLLACGSSIGGCWSSSGGGRTMTSLVSDAV